MVEAKSNASQSSVMAAMIPIMFCFFSMGFVDLCGVCSNQIKTEFNLTDAQANLVPTLTFIWFFICSVPVSLLMNKIGRKNTVIVSMIITCVAMAVPMFTGSYYGLVVAFSIVGIGNVFLQTSLNPLVSNVISPQHLASTLTFGQFIKAFVGITGPLILGWCLASGPITTMYENNPAENALPESTSSALEAGNQPPAFAPADIAANTAQASSSSTLPNFGLSWRAMFPYYGVIGLIALFLIWRVQIHEEKQDKVSGFGECLRLLGDGFVLCCFIAIICHVGIDVGTNTTAPRFLKEVWPGQPDSIYLFACTVYFVARMISCLLGAWLLRVMPAKLFFLCGVILVGAGLILLWTSPTRTMVYISVILIALGNSNLFSVAFSQALNRRPNEGNEVSGLMIMGVSGGAIIPPAMGIASDALNSQGGAVLVLMLACAFLLFYTFMIKSINTGKN